MANEFNIRKGFVSKADSIITGSLTVTGQADTLLVQGSGSTANTTIMAIDGNNGRLFEISDDLSDSLFSVNTIAGLPVMEAFADNRVVLGAYNQNDLVISGSRVGIGTNAPGEKLDISGSIKLPTITGEGIRFVAGSAPSGLTWYNAGGVNDGPQLISYGSVHVIIDSDNNDNNTRFFSVSRNGTNYGSATELFRVTEVGNVGIGTTAPTQLLEVAGAAQVDKLYFVSSSNFITVDQATATNMSFTLNELQVARLHRVGSLGATLKLEQFSTGGTAQAYPAYTFLDDDNTGMFLYNTDILGFSTSGSAKMVITSDGNVGIGTTSPLGKLHVENSAVRSSVNGGADNIVIEENGYSGITILSNSANAGQIHFGDQDVENIGMIQYFHSDNSMRFATGNATEKMRIDTSGNVGIGTTSMTAKLVVRGADSTSDFADYGIAVFENQQSEGLSIGYDTDGNYTYLYSRELGVSSRGLRLNGSIYVPTYNGNVGIGTTSPATKLHVSTDFAVTTTDYVQGSTGSRILLKPFASTGDTYSFIQAQDIGGTSNNALALQPYGDNVGIGTTSPSSKLHVAGGNIMVSNTVAAGSSVGGIIFKQTNSTGFDIAQIQGIAGATVVEGILSFSTKDSSGTMAERMRITSAGSVGIGTTSPTHKLHVSGSVNIEDDLTFGIGGFLGTSTSEFTMYSLGDIIYNSDSNNNGTSNHIFQESGNELLRITAAGNVGIGTNNPAYKLDVHGDARVTGSVVLSGDLTVAGRVTAEEFHTEFVSASILYQSGSTKFGDTSDDVHSFTGSLNVRGNAYILAPTGDAVLTIEADPGNSNENDNPRILLTQDGGLVDTVIGINGDPDNAFPGAIVNATYINSSGATQFAYGSIPYMTIATDGNVGIGTTTPSARLEVAGAGYFSGESLSTGLDQTYTNVALLLDEGDYIYTKDSSTTLRILMGKVADVIKIGQNGTSLIDGIELIPGTTGGYVSVFDNTTETARFQNGRFLLGTTTPATAPDAITPATAEIRYSSATGLYINGTRTNPGTGGNNSGSYGLVVSASNYMANNGTNSYGAYIQSDSATASNTRNYGVYAKSLRQGAYGSYPAVALYGHSTHRYNSGNLTIPLDSDLVGVWSLVDFENDNNPVTSSAEMYNFYGEAVIPANKIVDDYYGIFLKAPTVNGAITNNRFGIYQEGTSEKNYFAGSVGIGTTSPTQKLDVSGNIVIPRGNFLYFRRSGVDNPILWQGDGTFGSADQLYLRQPNNNNLHFQTNGGNTRMLITGDGNVGIGTTSPNGKLQVDGDIYVNGADRKIMNYNGAVDYGTLTNNSVRFNTAGTEKVRITGDGNVGIGTTSPSQKLEVSFAASVYGARFTRNDAAGSSLIEFANNAGVKSIVGYDAGVDGYRIGTPTANNLTVKQSGNVGIGTTSPSQKLHVNGSLRVTGAYYDSGNSAGTSGQILSSTGTGTDWVSLNELTGVDGTGAATQVTYWHDANTVTGSGDFTWDGTRLTINGTLEATEKSFVIDHPTQPGNKLVYGVLEGPEHAVYVRGKISGEVIQLPEEWTGLVDEDSITVQLTAIGKHQNLYVADIKDNKVFIKNGDLLSSKVNAYYFIQGTRKDVKPLQTVRQK